MTNTSNAIALQTYRQLPDISVGYALNEDGPSWVSVIVPEASRNFIPNPSFEVGNPSVAQDWLWGGIVVGATKEASTEQQYVGGRSYKFTMTGTSHTEVTDVSGDALPAGTDTYTLSLFIRLGNGPSAPRPRENTVRLRFDTTLIAPSGREYAGNGWWRVWATQVVTGPAEVGFQLNGEVGDVFYIDGVQCEAKAYPTTYIDGTIQPLVPSQTPAAIYWLGTPHLSGSVRTVTTRAGGRVRNFDTYNFTLLGITGMGMAPVDHYTESIGQLPGRTYQDSRNISRQFTLIGRFDADNPVQLMRDRSQLHRVLSHYVASVHQPLRLIVQPYRCDEAIGDPIWITCSYVGGLEENFNSLHSEQVTITFEVWESYIASPYTDGFEATFGSVDNPMNQVAYKRPDGTWRGLEPSLPITLTEFSRQHLIEFKPNGRFSYYNNRPTPEFNDYYEWNIELERDVVFDQGPSAANPLRAAEYAPDGLLWVAANTGASSTVSPLWRWDPNAFSWGNIGPALSNVQVYDILYWSVADGNDLVFVAGADNLNVPVLWEYNINATTWTNRAAGTTNSGFIFAMVRDGDRLYYSGSFTNLTGVPEFDYILYRDPAAGTTTAIASGPVNNSVTGLKLLSNGALLVKGIFSGNLALWQSGSWTTPLLYLNGLTVSGGNQEGIAQDPLTKKIYVVAGGGLNDQRPYSLFRNGALLPMPNRVVNPGTISGITASRDYVAISGIGANETAGLGIQRPDWRNVDYKGSAPTHLQVIIWNRTNTSFQMRAGSIHNQTTDQGVWFRLTPLIEPREWVYLNLEPGNFIAYSNFRGDLSAQDILMDGSDVAINLIPGLNRIGGFAFEFNENTVPFRFFFFWQRKHASIDDAVIV